MAGPASRGWLWAGLLWVGLLWVGLLWVGLLWAGLLWAGLGVIALSAHGFVATLQPDAQFGRILTAYGGVFVAGSLAWGMALDSFRPDRWDVIDTRPVSFGSQDAGGYRRAAWTRHRWHDVARMQLDPVDDGGPDGPAGAIR